MADEAFDAFSQKRDTGTKSRVTDTKVVETSTDPNRYRLPPNRRVRVVADQLDMTIDPEKEQLAKLAEGLTKVKPKLFEKFTNQAIEENIAQVDLGKQAAMTQTPGELKRLQDKIDNKWFKFGASAESAYQQGEDLSAKLSLDMANRRRDVSYEDAYAAWWKENQPTDIDPQFLATFNDSFRPNANKVKNQDVKREYELNRANAMAKSTRNVVDTIIEARKNGHHILAALDALKANEQAMYHFDNSTWNEVKFYAVTAAADELDDPALLDVFNKSTFDQVTGQEIPGMAYTGEYQVKIRNYQDKLIRENERRENQAKTDQARLDNKLLRTDAEKKQDIKMHIGDDGYISQLNGDQAATIRARSYETQKVYTNAVKRMLKENNQDGTAKYPIDSEEKQMELREKAYEEAERFAVGRSWSNDVLTKQRQQSALVAKNNEFALYRLRKSDAGKETLINFYRYQSAIARGETVPEELITALPFDPSPELKKVAMKIGENEHKIATLTEARRVLMAENLNRRQDNYTARLEALDAQIADQEALRAGLVTPDVDTKEKTKEDVREEVERSKDAEFPGLEEMFIDEEGGVSAFAAQNYLLADRYTEFKNAKQMQKDRASGAKPNPPEGYKSWDTFNKHVEKERAYFSALDKRRKEAHERRKK